MPYDRAVERIYDALTREHLGENRQIALLSGPRQVGKTTSARAGAGDHVYYSWDRQSDRILITRGPDAVAEDLGLPSPERRLGMWCSTGSTSTGHGGRS